MIEVLRKARQKLLKNGNLRKYFWYALGEIALVVIGILIALQINNWNEARLNRSYELTMLEDIKESLEGDINSVNLGIENLNNIRESVLHLSKIQNDQSYPNDSLLYHLDVVIDGGIAITFNHSAYESIKSTGLNKISNPDLRRQLTLLYEVQLVSVEGWINEVVRETLYDKADFARSYFEFKLTADSQNELNESIVNLSDEMVYEDPRFDVFLSLSSGYIPSSEYWLNYGSNKMQLLMTEIEQELEKEK